MTNEIFSKAEKNFYGLKLYGAPVPTISGEAHIRIEVKESTPYSTFAKIQAEIEEALFILREEEGTLPIARSVPRHNNMSIKGVMFQKKETLLSRCRIYTNQASLLTTFI